MPKAGIGREYQSMKTVLVTGVTGFVGSALAAGFIKNGIKVVAISRNDNSGWRTLKAIEEANLVFFVTDYSSGILPFDFELSSVLRKTKIKK